ncbi:Tm-1-like ATP-binding domain-containing protein [Nonomuraea ferruginea]
MTVVLIGTLDTKGEEYGWLRDRLTELGQEVVVIDAGTGDPGVPYPVDHPNDRVAAAAGADLEALRAARATGGRRSPRWARARRRCWGSCTRRGGSPPSWPWAAAVVRRSPRGPSATCRSACPS